MKEIESEFREVSPNWTKGAVNNLSLNMYQYNYIKHKDDFAQIAPALGVDNGITYVLNGRALADTPLQSSTHFESFIRERPCGVEKVVVNKTTREFVVRIESGAEAGALKTYYPVDPALDIEQYILQNKEELTKTHQLTLKRGEISENRQTYSGKWACPVCGHFFDGEAPYSMVLAVNNQPVTPFAAGSQDVCPCCNTQWGYDDFVTDSQSQTDKWTVLRNKWLQSVNYAPLAVKQLENFEIEKMEWMNSSTMTENKEFITCPCCGYKTIYSDYDICHICFWEHDEVQESDPDNDNGGPNRVTLSQGQKNYAAFGACERDMMPHVQKPSPDDVRDPNWKPLP